MTPPRARTWGRIGRTPVVRVRRLPTVHLRAGPQPAGRHLAAGQSDVGNLAAADLGQITRAVKHGLEQFQHHSDLVDSCLDGTGLTMDS